VLVAIAEDVIGSVHEASPVKTTGFALFTPRSRFTDDTTACITGGIAQAFCGAVPEQIAREVRSRLPAGFLDVLDRFERRFGSANANPRMA
jgi:ADP-ribosylglycohydrolase